MAQGGDFGSSFLAGSLGSVGGSVFQVSGGSFASSFLGVSAFSALNGGIGEVVGGGKFWEGVSKGAIIGAANHGLHMGAKALFGGPEKGAKANKNNNTLKSFRAVETGGKYSGYADAGREIAQEIKILKYQSEIINNSFKWSGL